MGNGEVELSHPKRRRFSASYKLGVLVEVDTLAYETDWGMHGGALLRGRNLFGGGESGSLEPVADKIQKRMEGHVAWSFSVWEDGESILFNVA